MTRPQTHIWRRLDVEGTGIVRLEARDDGYVADGFEVTSEGAVRFQVIVDASWRTREARLDAIGPRSARSIVLTADAAGGWTVDGEARPDLAGALDVDIAATPFTNTLPIRRLDLDPDEEADVRAVWVGVPDLEVEVLAQVYRRLPDEADLRTYEYRPVGSPRGRVLTVDDDGVVVRYERFAERIDALTTP